MNGKLAATYLPLIRYALLMGALGGIASLIGPPHHFWIKAGIGIIAGAALLGRRLPKALNNLLKITDDISDEIFHD